MATGSSLNRKKMIEKDMLGTGEKNRKRLSK
jgi:hypothetical protein